MIHLKRQLGADQFARPCAHEPIADAAVNAVDQRAANCLEAVRSFTAMQSRCRSSASPSVVHCEFFQLFGAPSVHCFKLVSLWNSTAAHELQLRDRKILLLEG
ncbi:hypothetical protein TNCV_3980891 [Trichonephila clavipes]|nr:hypothetical protein TNCV_3980891 [Trichonephila clavipes]